MQMEKDFVKGQSDNLPKLDSFAMFSFLGSNPDFFSAEIKGVKVLRSGRENYGDNAVGYVQVRRQANICTVRAKITPEHRVSAKPYTVELIVDEKEEAILSVQCQDCAASLGGCKHAVSLITWVHRRSEEPSPTSVESYWKKARLSEVGSKLKFIKARDIPAPNSSRDDSASSTSFLDAIIMQSKSLNRENTAVSRYFRKEKDVEKLSLHFLSWDFFATYPDGSPEDFLLYCSSRMAESACREAELRSTDQAKNPLWFELRHARITASKIHEASQCKTLDGSLVETLLGATKIRDTKAMKRGRELENMVKKVVEKETNIKFKKCGLKLLSKVPVHGASADGLSGSHVLEVKCPSSEKAMKTYIADGKVKKRYAAQIQMQLHMYGKEKGLFCVAYPDFEYSKQVVISEVEYDSTLVESLITKSTTFWKEAIFPSLKKRFF